MSFEIHISSNINDEPKDYAYLFKLWRTIQENPHADFTFKFTGCGFLQQNAVAFIGGLVRLVLHRGNDVYFQLSSIQDNVRVNLEQNGFLHQLGFTEQGYARRPWKGNSIPYREDKKHDDDSFVDYLSEKWLGRNWIDVDDSLKDHITQPIIEAYINVFDHANSPIGVITCGQYYPQRKRLKLAMVDFGIGIPNSVRSFQNDPNLPSEEAIEWAFQKGTTTKKGNPVARGVGLEFLKDFIEDNGGKLEIYSDTGYARIESGREETYSKRRIGFDGTLVQITLQCKERFYQLPSIQDFDSGDDWF
jgi:anti-sigma regulatory factor (Ser/Thr protein kinase)